MKITYNLGIGILTAILLTGCGFKTQTASLPQSLHKFYYQADNSYGEFETAFKRFLKNSKVTILSIPTKSFPIVNISANYSCNTQGAYSSTTSRAYTLYYNATISISDYSDKPILNPKIVSTSRDITLKPNEMIETTPQVAIAKHEMQQELFIKILNILNAKNTTKTLSLIYLK